MNRVAAWGYNANSALAAGYKGLAERLAVPCVGFDDVVSVTAADHTSYAITSSGQVLVCGGGGVGQGGNGSRQDVSKPTLVKGLSGVTQLAAAGGQVKALLSNGTVASWGGSAWGSLGTGKTGKGKEGPCSAVPVIVPLARPVVQVVCGGAAVAALTDDGNVWTWGPNGNGQLGDGTQTERPTPVRAKIAGVKRIFAGGLAQGGFMIAELRDGSWMGWGTNHLGELGRVGVKQTSTPVPLGLGPIRELQLGAHHCVALRPDGSVDAWGSEVALGVKGMTGASLVDAGAGFSLVAAGGKLYASGHNRFGTLGDATGEDKYAPVEVFGIKEPSVLAAGTEHALAMVPQSTLPLPVVGLTPGVGALALRWRSGPVKPSWRVAWRTARSKTWSLPVTVQPTVREYLISGLASGVATEVALWTMGPSSWERKVLEAVPG